MTLKDWLIILITTAVAVPVALFSPFGTDWLDKRRALRNETRAKARDEELVRNLARIEDYKDEPRKFQGYLLGRLLLITILWIGQEVVDYILGIAVNLQYSAANLTKSYTPLNTSATLTQAGESLTDTVLLTIVLLIGIRTYRLYQHVSDYDKYKKDVDLERNRLAEKFGTSPNLDVEQIISDGMERGQDPSSIAKEVLDSVEAQKLKGRQKDRGGGQN